MKQTKQDLINRSIFERKPTKPAAQELLLALFEGLTEEQQEQYITGIAQLWNWFMPPVPKVAKTDIDWVAQAVNKLPERPMSLMYSSGQWLYATDGSRAHRVPTELEMGYYLPSGHRVDCDRSYDMMKSRIDDLFLQAQGGEIVTTKDLPVYEDEGEVMTVTLAGRRLNRSYALQALGGVDEAWVAQTIKNAVVIHPQPIHSGRQAVIMPREKKHD